MNFLGLFPKRMHAIAGCGFLKFRLEFVWGSENLDAQLAILDFSQVKQPQSHTSKFLCRLAVFPGKSFRFAPGEP